MKPLKIQCKALKSDDTQCQAAALPGLDFCFFHEPSKAAERREAQVQGGRQNRMKTLEATAPDIRIGDSKDVYDPSVGDHKPSSERAD